MIIIGLIKSELDSIKKQENVHHIDHSLFLMSHQDCHRSAFVPQRHFSWEKGHHISLVVMGHLIVQQDVKKNEMSFCSFLCCCFFSNFHSSKNQMMALFVSFPKKSILLELELRWWYYFLLDESPFRRAVQLIAFCLG